MTGLYKLLSQESVTLEVLIKNHLMETGIIHSDLNEQLVFPEVEYDKVRDIRGMNITICTSANDNEPRLCIITIARISI